MNRNRLAAVLIALLVTLLFAWQANVHAAESPASGAEAAPACGGADLLADLEANQPARYRAILDSERRTSNGNALMWKIEKDGVAPTFLYGTMHMSDRRLTRLAPAAAEALDASRTVALELAEIVDEEKFNAATIRNIRRIAFTDGRNLETLLSRDEAAQVEAALTSFGMPYANMKMMKPWFVAVAMALPPCETERKKAGIEALDVVIGRKALANGARLVGLETVDEQFAAFDGLALDDQKNMLLSAARLAALLDDQIETMTRLYVAQRTGALWGFARELTRLHATPATEAAELGALERFGQELVVKRNRTMAKRAKPLIEKGGAFIAVGAMHLPGDQGLVALLQQAGYRVTPVR